MKTCMNPVRDDTYFKRVFGSVFDDVCKRHRVAASWSSGPKPGQPTWTAVVVKSGEMKGNVGFPKLEIDLNTEERLCDLIGVRVLWLLKEMGIVAEGAS